MHKIEKHLEWGRIMEGSSLGVQAVFIQDCKRTKQKKMKMKMKIKKKVKKKAESRKQSRGEKSASFSPTVNLGFRLM